jgi:hypothetical protein
MENIILNMSILNQLFTDAENMQITSLQWNFNKYSLIIILK